MQTVSKTINANGPNCLYYVVVGVGAGKKYVRSVLGARTLRWTESIILADRFNYEDARSIASIRKGAKVEHVA